MHAITARIGLFEYLVVYLESPHFSDEAVAFLVQDCGAEQAGSTEYCVVLCGCQDVGWRIPIRAGMIDLVGR